MRKIIIGAICLGVLFSAAFDAAADISQQTISAYNTAVNAGDTDAKLAAAKALATEAMANPGDEQAALLAYEAAWLLCRSGDCGAAIEPAKFAAGQPAGDAHPSADSRTLLLAYAQWDVKPNGKTRKALDTALDAVAGSDPTLLSVQAFQMRYQADMRNRRYRKASRSASAAASHFEKAGDVLVKLQTAARSNAIVADFYYGPKSKHVSEMLHLKGRLGKMRQISDKDEPDWLKPAYYRADAWAAAMNAVLNSSGKPSISDEEETKILAQYKDDAETANARGESKRRERGKLPFCEGHLEQVPAMEYPSSANFRRMVGAVIIGFDFEDGAVVNPAILASVPDEGFKEKALEIVSQWKFVPDEEQAEGECTLDRDNIVQSFIFRF